MTQPATDIPASVTVVNLVGEPLALPGLRPFAVSESRDIDLSSFGLSQRSLIWNAIYNAQIRGWVTAAAATFDVVEIATGHQGSINRGGHGVGGSVVSVPGGLGLPDTVTFTNELDDPLSIVGIIVQPGDSFTYDMTLVGINQQSLVWNALVNAEARGYISSADLGAAVTAGFTGQQEHGGQGDVAGGQVSFLHETVPESVVIGGQVVTVRGQDITVRGQ